MTLIRGIKDRLSKGRGDVERCLLIVGLGNPGERYAATRHNAGFMAIDALASEVGTDNWRLRCDSLVAEKKLSCTGVATLVVLAKPQTMMNLSGRAVKGLLRHYQLGLDMLCVLHDDIDLPPHSLRVKSGGGHGGHNGIRSIVDTVGSDFIRFKIGVGSPPGRMDSADYVLQPLKGETLEQLRCDAAETAEAVLYFMDHGLLQTQNRFN